LSRADAARRSGAARPIGLAQLHLRWISHAGQCLAQATCDEQHLRENTLDHGRLAILVDALEKSGCPNPNILGHCRSEGEHERGCWAIDALLGKS
jgi:hypothetical protein